MDHALSAITAATDVRRHAGYPADPAVAPPSAASASPAAAPTSEPPPSELQAAYRDAHRVAEELAARGVVLHFEYDEEARRVIIDVRRSDGTLIRQIPPREMFAALSGGAGILLDRKA
jgi:hypothetical protein